MAKKLSRLTTEQRYELVAYLDNELDEARTARIEALLAESNVARTDIDLLARTYELLDLLPRVKMSSEFTERTMATARLEEVKPDHIDNRLQQRVRGWFVTAGWVAAMCGAAMIGYGITRHAIPQPHDLLINELEVIEHLNEFIEVGSPEFLEALANRESLMQDLRGEHPHVTPHE